jgi:hypothetical protein
MESFEQSERLSQARDLVLLAAEEALAKTQVLVPLVANVFSEIAAEIHSFLQQEAARITESFRAKEAEEGSMLPSLELSGPVRRTPRKRRRFRMYGYLKPPRLDDHGNPKPQRRQQERYCFL